MTERRGAPGRRDGDGILEEIRAHVQEMARDIIDLSVTVGNIQSTATTVKEQVQYTNGSVKDHEIRLREIERQSLQELGATNYRKWMFGVVIAVVGSIVLQGIGLMVLISR